jgi:adenosylcobinamide-GDP ribazoletransferase
VTAFLLAVQFLTRVPVPLKLAGTDKQLGLSVLYYPLVGLLIGVGMFLLSRALMPVAVPVQAALLLVFWVLITGGLHLDGLADCADAWAGGLSSPQRSLEIMKDPAAGPIAVLSLLLLLLLKWTVLVELLAKSQLAGLILTPMLGRCAILALMLSTPYLRKDGLGSVLSQVLPTTAAKIILFHGLLLGAYSLGLMPIIFASLMLLWLRKLALHRLGGVTGDVYGAAVELVEVAVLVGLVLS